MNESSSGALLTIRPTLPAATGSAVFIGVGFVLLMISIFLAFMVTALTGRGIVGVGAAGALWALGMVTFARKTKQNMEDSRYEFHRDRLVFRMRDKVESMEYAKIGHVLFKNGRTFLFNQGFEGLKPPRHMRVDVPREEGDPKFHEVIDLIRRACPQHLFSYQNGRVEYSRRVTSLPGIEDRRVSRIKSVAGRSAFGELEIVIDEADQPAFTLVRPYSQKKQNFYDVLAVIRNDGREREGYLSNGEVLLGFAGTDVSKNLDLEWARSDIVTGGGVHVGQFRIKRKMVSPIDDFELQVLDDTLKLRGDLLDRHYALTLNGTPVGRMSSRLFSLTQANEVVFTTPVDMKIALCLALATNYRMGLDREAGT